MAKQGWFSLVVIFLLGFLACSEAFCIYSVFIKTGSVDGAGTDAGVDVEIYDQLGNGLLISDIYWDGVMPSGHNYFEKGNLDVFVVKGDCLATEICKLKVRHDNSMGKAGWYVDYIDVAMTGPKKQCNEHSFSIDQWLADDEPPYSLSATRDDCSSSKFSSSKPLAPRVAYADKLRLHSNVTSA